jgi:hypothetical protein
MSDDMPLLFSLSVEAVLASTWAPSRAQGFLQGVEGGRF